MNLLRGGTVLALLVVVNIAAPRQSSATEMTAEDKAKAARLFDEGKKHFKLGEFQDALQSFKSAYRAAPVPTILFNIGQCYRQLNDRENAINLYRSYLSEVPDAAN